MGSIVLFIIIIFSLLIIYKLFFETWSPSILDGLNKKNFFYYGHRGAPNLAPENTLISFQKAIDYSLDGLELDVQLTLDSKLIIYHDRLINYNHNQIGINKLNLSDIKKINVNTKFKNLDNQYIPTLKEVFEILPKNIILNIEIKSYRGSNSNYIINQVLDLIDSYSIYDQIIISSFNPFIINKIKKINQLICTAFIWCNDSYYNYKLFSYFSKPDIFHVDINDVNSNMVEWFSKKNINIYAYTVNNESDLAKAKLYNLNGIFTDNPKIKNV